MLETKGFSMLLSAFEILSSVTHLLEGAGQGTGAAPRPLGKLALGVDPGPLGLILDRLLDVSGVPLSLASFSRLVPDAPCAHFGSL